LIRNILLIYMAKTRRNIECGNNNRSRRAKPSRKIVKKRTPSKRKISDKKTLKNRSKIQKGGGVFWIFNWIACNWFGMNQFCEINKSDKYVSESEM